MKGSKTRESGRVDLLVRMPPELKKRVAEAAQEGHESLTDWVLVAIEARLAARDADTQKRKDIEAIENRQAAKYNEILALLAAKRRTGGLAKPTGKDRIELEDMAISELEKWKDKVGKDHRAQPKTELERLCREHEDIGDEIDRVRNKDYNRDIERIMGEQGYDWDDDGEFVGADEDSSVVEAEDDPQQDAEEDLGGS